MTHPTLCFIDTETTGLDPERHEIWEVACCLRSWPDGENYRDDEYVWQLPVDLTRADLIALSIGNYRERRWPSSVPGSMADQLEAIHASWDGHAPADDTDLTKQRVMIEPDRMGQWAGRFSALTWGAHMIGAVPSFDTDRLSRLLLKHGSIPAWHYQPADVETLIAGFLIGRARGIALTCLSDPQANEAATVGIQTHGIGSYSGALDASRTARVLPWDSDELSRLAGIDPDRYERHSALGDVRWARDLWDAVVNPRLPAEVSVFPGRIWDDLIQAARMARDELSSLATRDSIRVIAELDAALSAIQRAEPGA